MVVEVLELAVELVLGPIYRRFLGRKTRRPLRAAQLWALAAGANLARLNGSSLTSLHTGRLPMVSRRILRVWWGVVDRMTLRNALERLAAKGHRAQFAELHALLGAAALSLEGRVALRRAGLLGRPVVEFVRRNHARFKNGDLVAWDFCRLINVARYGYSAGYLPEEEAWGAILAAARVLQREYGSWAELSENYLLGFSYWQEGGAPDRWLAEAADWLAESPESPWRNLRWLEWIE
jgi:hypothetical protein